MWYFLYTKQTSKALIMTNHMQERSCKGKEQAKTLEDLAIYSYLRFVDYLYHHSHFRDN